MSATETSTLLGGNKPQQTRKAEPRSRFIFGGALAVSTLCVLGASFYGYKAYGVYRRNALVGGWEERTQAVYDKGTQTCSSCALVIPSDLLKGQGKGAAIDSHDCVIRFNGHHPEDAPVEDWGSKDNFRVINAFQVDTVSQTNDKCFDVKDPGCRRIVVTWETGSVEGFLGEHEQAELLQNIASTYWPGEDNVHQPLYDFAVQNELPSPMFGSSAYCSVYTLRHPQICGTMTIFGVPTTNEYDTVGYLDPHGPPSAAHQYGVEHELYRKWTDPANPKPGWENVHLDDLKPEIPEEVKQQRLEAEGKLKQDELAAQHEAEQAAAIAQPEAEQADAAVQPEAEQADATETQAADSDASATEEAAAQTEQEAENIRQQEAEEEAREEYIREQEEAAAAREEYIRQQQEAAAAQQQQ